MRNEKGATTLEAAITIGPFLMIVFGLIQLLLVAYTAFSVQYNVNFSLREGVVKDPTVNSATRFNNIKNDLVAELKKFNISAENITVNMCSGIVENCKDQDPGGNNEFVTLQARVKVFSVAGENFSVTGRAVAKNEPY